MQLTDKQKENVKLWLAALRSGEYRQTSGLLSDGNGYCCLGVACDVYAKQTGNGHWSDSHRPTFVVTDIEMRENIESEAVKQYFGFDDQNGFQIPPFYVNDKGTTQPIRLTEVNDEIGMSFEEIADLVEKYILNGEQGMTPQEIERYLLDHGTEY